MDLPWEWTIYGIDSYIYIYIVFFPIVGMVVALAHCHVISLFKGEFSGTKKRRRQKTRAVPKLHAERISTSKTNKLWLSHLFGDFRLEPESSLGTGTLVQWYWEQCDCGAAVFCRAFDLRKFTSPQRKKIDLAASVVSFIARREGINPML